MSPKEIAEKILKSRDEVLSFRYGDSKEEKLAKAYLQLENTASGLEVTRQALESEITKLKEENCALLRESEYLRQECEKLKFQSSIFNDTLKQNRELETQLSLEQQDRESEKRTYKTRIEATEGYISNLNKKLRLANDTIHGEFCGEKCHPLHLEVEI